MTSKQEMLYLKRLESYMQYARVRCFNYVKLMCFLGIWVDDKSKHSTEFQQEEQGNHIWNQSFVAQPPDIKKMLVNIDDKLDINWITLQNTKIIRRF